MSRNPYALPEAYLADVPVSSSEDRAQPPFFAASPLKVLVLSFCTLGIYQYYWFYKHWQHVRDGTNERMSPFWRTFFAIVWCYQLFHRIRAYRGTTSAAAGLSAGPLAVAWIVAELAWRLPDPYGLLTFLSVFALLPVQAAANAVNREVAPHHLPNSRFTRWNWIGVALGGPTFLLAVCGSLLPPQ